VPEQYFSGLDFLSRDIHAILLMGYKEKAKEKKKQEPTTTMNGGKIKQEQNSLLLST